MTLRPSDLTDRKAAREVYLEEQCQLPDTPDRGADRLAQAQARQQLATTFLPEAPGDDGADEVYAAELIAVGARAGLSALELAVMAYELDDLTQSQTAAALDRSLGTVKSASWRARKKLRRLAREFLVNRSRAT